MKAAPLKKDKQKVTEEVFTEAMLKSFLSDPVASEDDVDFRRLLFAYRGMPAPAFGRFLNLFVDAGFSLQAKDHKGRDFLTYLERFPAHSDYVDEFRSRLNP